MSKGKGSSTPVFDAVRQAVREQFGARVEKAVTEEANEAVRENYTSSRGALTEPVAEACDGVDRGAMQLVALFCREIKRRDTLSLMLGLATFGYGLGHGVKSQRAERAQRIYDDQKLTTVQVLKIWRCHDNEVRLRELKRDFGSLHPKEGFLIDCILDHGRGFDQVRRNDHQLKNLTHGSVDPDVLAFVDWTYASSKRLLGCTDEALAAIEKHPLHALDPVLRWLVMEMQYSNWLPYSLVDPGRLVKNVDFGASLQRDIEQFLHIKPADIRARDYPDIIHRATTSDVLEPIGLYYTWQFFRAGSEAEAATILEKTRDLARALVKYGTTEQETNRYAIRKAWRHVARLMPFAYLRDFNRIADRIMSACEDANSPDAIMDRQLLEHFHKAEAGGRSPAYLNYMLIRSLRDFERSRDARLFAKHFMLDGEYRAVHHTALDKAIAFVGLLVGSPHDDCNVTAALPTGDPGALMRLCIAKARGKACSQ